MGLIIKASRSWLRNDRGTVAIEFALVIMPFALLAVAIIEMAIMYTANSIMLGATQDAVRAVRTGQIQTIEESDEAEKFFREQICNHIQVRLVDCNSMQFMVRVLDNFADAATTTEVDEDGNLVDDSIDFGEADDVVLVNVLYYHPMLSPFTAAFFADSPGNKKLLTATFVFQTEPYPDEE